MNLPFCRHSNEEQSYFSQQSKASKKSQDQKTLIQHQVCVGLTWQQKQARPSTRIHL